MSTSAVNVYFSRECLLQPRMSTSAVNVYFSCRTIVELDTLVCYTASSLSYLRTQPGHTCVCSSGKCSPSHRQRVTTSVCRHQYVTTTDQYVSPPVCITSVCRHQRVSLWFYGVATSVCRRQYVSPTVCIASVCRHQYVSPTVCIASVCYNRYVLPPVCVVTAVCSMCMQHMRRCVDRTLLCNILASMFLL